VDGNSALRRAGAEFRTRLRQAGPDGWHLPTPCDEWDVHALVNHVVGGNVRYRMILEGAPDDAVAATHGQNMLGPDPMASFDQALAELEDAFAAFGDLDRLVRHPKSGEMSARQLRLLRVDELAVHAWDLARGLGADDRLDGELVAWLYERMRVIEAFIAGSGMYADLGPAPESGDLQERLLHLVGRR
jgi:uncharacterized protein (TIGR03086 family)